MPSHAGSLGNEKFYSSFKVTKKGKRFKSLKEFALGDTTEIRDFNHCFFLNWNI